MAQALAPLREEPAHPRHAAAARGFGVGFTLIAGGNGGAAAPGSALVASPLGAGATAAGDGTGTASSGGTFASRSRRSRCCSIRSTCFACCSTARSASQLASALASMVRDGACHGPFSAIESVGRGPPTCDGVPASVSTASSEPSTRSTFAAADRSAPLVRATTWLSRACPAAMVMAASARAASSVPFSSAVATKSRMRPGSVGTPRSTARITASNTRGLRLANWASLERDGAGAGQRADKCGGAAAGRLEFSAQRHLPRNRRPLRTAADDCRRIGIVQRRCWREPKHHRFR